MSVADANANTDPTANVLALVHAEGRRQDDLREMNDRHLRDMITSSAESNRELIAVRAEYEEKLRLGEARRIDAIRAVDVSALNRATEVTNAQAAALAAQVTVVADTFRTALTTELAVLRSDIADLRASQSEAIGSKTQVVEQRSASGEIRLIIGSFVGVLMLILVAAGVIISLNT